MNPERRFASKTGRRVLVVGAGLAGMFAARELSRRDFDVTVVEARSSVGGRTRSDRTWLPGIAIERGGEFVGSNHPRVLALAEELGVALDPVEEAELVLRELDGERFQGEALKRLYAEAIPLRTRLVEHARRVDDERPWLTPEAAELDRLSLCDGLFADPDATDAAKRLLCAEFEQSEATDPALISWLGQLVVIKGHGLERYWEETEAFRVRGGAASLVEGLAREFSDDSKSAGNRLRFDSPVVAVSQTEDGVQVSLSGGQVLRADWLVLAVPASQLRKIDLPGELRSLAALFCGAASKEFVKVDEASTLSVATRASLSRLAGGIYPAPVRDTNASVDAVTLFSASTAAERRVAQEDSARREDLVDVVREIGYLPTNDEGGWTKTDWSKEAFFDGAYSCAQLGKIVDLGSLLYEGAGRILIAGEHASFRFTGYMEGALESAERACRRICDRANV